MTWAATEAKAKFSEVLDKAQAEGPQLVRRRKQKYLIMTSEQFEAAVQTKEEPKPFVSAWEALRPSSGATFDVEFERLSGKARAAEF